MPPRKASNALDSVNRDGASYWTPHDPDLVRAELRKHHPDMFGPDDPGRLYLEAPDPVDLGAHAAFALEDGEVDRVPIENPQPVRPKSRADFVEGRFVSTLSPIIASSAFERVELMRELLAIRDGLIEEFGSTSMSDLTLVDSAALAFVRARRIETRAAAMLNATDPGKMRALEVLDGMLRRAHSQFLSALEMLRRGKVRPLKIEVRDAGRVHVGDEVIAIQNGAQDDFDKPPTSSGRALPAASNPRSTKKRSRGSRGRSRRHRE
jgi:hypothetical protein